MVGKKGEERGRKGKKGEERGRKGSGKKQGFFFFFLFL